MMNYCQQITFTCIIIIIIIENCSHIAKLKGALSYNINWIAILSNGDQRNANNVGVQKEHTHLHRHYENQARKLWSRFVRKTSQFVYVTPTKLVVLYKQTNTAVSREGLTSTKKGLILETCLTKMTWITDRTYTSLEYII